MTRRLSRLVAVLISAVTLTGLAPALVAEAHHTTVSCQSPGVWRIVNSEADKAMTFTTNRGHAGSIGPGGETTVAYSGTSLTVSGVWSNGATSTDTGTGDCRIPNTTTTTTTSTTSTTTTTTPETTTTSTPPPSSIPATTTTPSTSSVPPSAPSTQPPAHSSVPPTSEPRPSVTTSVPSSTLCETATFDPSSPNAGRCWQLVATL